MKFHALLQTCEASSMILAHVLLREKGQIRGMWFKNYNTNAITLRVRVSFYSYRKI
jgi:hypothetical protein